MQPRPSFDRTLLIPIAIGIVSILGLGWIVLTSVFGKPRSPLPPTAIPFSLSSLEAATLTPEAQTLSAMPTASLDETPETQTPSATATRPAASPVPPTETLTSTSTFVTASLPTPSATLTPDPARLLQAEKKYDDTDPRIVYDPYWTALKNPSTASSYKGTIHASSDAGSEASFRFTGTGFRLGYKRAKNFGTVTVIIDDQSYSFDEQAFDLVWNSSKLSPGDHFVRIIHDSGESINLDYIVILANK